MKICTYILSAPSAYYLAPEGHSYAVSVYIDICEAG